jgi:hypothetical protein
VSVANRGLEYRMRGIQRLPEIEGPRQEAPAEGHVFKN